MYQNHEFGIISAFGIHRKIYQNREFWMIVGGLLDDFGVILGRLLDDFCITFGGFLDDFRFIFWGTIKIIISARGWFSDVFRPRGGNFFNRF